MGKYLGLALTLALLAIAFMLGWQVIYTGYGMGFMGWKAVGIFSILSLSWLTMGAVSILFAGLSSYAVALFFVGMVSHLRPIISTYHAIDVPEAEMIRQIVSLFAGVWNLHYFNLHEYGQQTGFISPEQALQRVLYGLATYCWLPQHSIDLI